MAYMSCPANVRTVGKNKTNDARIVAFRRTLANIVAVEKSSNYFML